MAARRKVICCPRCKSTNVKISVVQDSFSTKGNGCLWGIGRTLLIVFTLGLWLVIGKHRAESKFKSHKEAICQDCGRSWKVK